MGLPRQRGQQPFVLWQDAKSRRKRPRWGRSPGIWASLLNRGVLSLALTLVAIGWTLALLFWSSGLLNQWAGFGAYLGPVVILSISLNLWPKLLTWPTAVGLTITWLSLVSLVEQVYVVGQEGIRGGLVGELLSRLLVQTMGQPGAVLLLVVTLVGGLVMAFWPWRRLLIRVPRVGLRLVRLLGRVALYRLTRWLLFAIGGGFRKLGEWAEGSELLTRAAAHIPWRRQHPAEEPEVSKAGEAPAKPSPGLRLPFLQPHPKAETVVKANGSQQRGRWKLPPITILDEGSGPELSEAELNRKATLIEQTLADFDVQARIVEVRPGPTVTQFGIEPGFHEKRDKWGAVVRKEKVKVSEITSLANDLALALAAPSIRIEAPVPGRPVIGIEVPNTSASMVSLRSQIDGPQFQRLRNKTRLALALGQDVSGQPVVADLTKMPHLLIAGATGSGKSVCINAVISTLLMHTTPDELRLLLIDPKRVELTLFSGVPHLLGPIVVDMDKVVPALEQALKEMDRRFREFAILKVRNIDAYNRIRVDRREPTLPYLVIVIDELADMMMMAPVEVERSICRLAQLARATGIHLIVATQRPSVDVLTGLIKANFPARVSFMVTSVVDSRTILDMGGAEKLLGRGDMLYMPSDAAKPSRLQGTFVSDDEIVQVVNFWREQREAEYVAEFADLPSWLPGSNGDEGEDLYDRALELAREYDSLSISFLQRRLRIGYNRAARLMEKLEDEGVVGPSDARGSRPVLDSFDDSSLT